MLHPRAAEILTALLRPRGRQVRRECRAGVGPLCWGDSLPGPRGATGPRSSRRGLAEGGSDETLQSPDHHRHAHGRRADPDHHRWPPSPSGRDRGREDGVFSHPFRFGEEAAHDRAARPPRHVRCRDHGAHAPGRRPRGLLPDGLRLPAGLRPQHHRGGGGGAGDGLSRPGQRPAGRRHHPGNAFGPRLRYPPPAGRERGVGGPAHRRRLRPHPRHPAGAGRRGVGRGLSRLLRRLLPPGGCGAARSRPRLFRDGHRTGERRPVHGPGDERPPGGQPRLQGGTPRQPQGELHRAGHVLPGGG